MFAVLTDNRGPCHTLLRALKNRRHDYAEDLANSI